MCKTFVWYGLEIHGFWSRKKNLSSLRSKIVQLKLVNTIPSPNLKFKVLWFIGAVFTYADFQKVPEIFGSCGFNVY
jgi:hypothetical protein